MNDLLAPLVSAIASSGGIAVLISVTCNFMFFWLLREERDLRAKDAERYAQALEKMGDAMSALGDSLNRTLAELRITIAGQR